MLSLKAEIEKKEREYNRKRAQYGNNNKIPGLFVIKLEIFFNNYTCFNVL